MTTKSSKQVFFEEVARLFDTNEVSSEARGYLYSALRTPEKKDSTNKRAEEARASILSALSMSAVPLSREQIVDFSGSDLSPNSISAYASRLVSDGVVKKGSQKYDKGRTQVVYSLVAVGV